MSSVSVFRPGSVIDSGDNWTTYRFTASVDGNLGYVTMTTTTGEADAASTALLLLQQRPDLLEGMV